MVRLHSAIGLILGALSALAVNPVTAADCTREGLIAAAQTYIAAQTAGKLDGIKQADNFTYQENNKPVNIKQGVLSQALKIDANRTAADTVECASYTMLISSGGSKPYVLATQIRHPGNDTSTISSIDTIAATTGSLFFNAAQTLKYIQAEDWTTLDPAQRSSRGLLKKYGDAYLDMWTNATAADTISWGTQCERVEGSRLTKPCGGSLPHGGSTKLNSMRRYVIDETIGSVDVLCAFNSIGDYPDSHEIRVEGGKVRYVHTITV